MIGAWAGVGSCWPFRTLAMMARPALGRSAAFLLLRALAISGLLAVLQLATSLYMLAVFDRVLPSGSVATLAVLTGLVVGLHMTFAVLDTVRARILGRAGLAFVERLDDDVLDALQKEISGGRFALLDDVERLRRFVTSAGPCAALDAVWLPGFLGALVLLHPMLGLFACGGALLLVSLKALVEMREREHGRGLYQTRRTRYVLAWDLYAGRSGAERRARWEDAAFHLRELSRSYSAMTSAAQDRAVSAMALGKSLRLFLQSAGLALGALLVIEGGLSPGALVASSLILARTFACLDGALLHWREFVVARGSYLRLAVAIEPKGLARS
jgi:ABC-type protease/lipase transport system fused ATPase/permease subunit